jgi:type II secretory pathway component PulM
MSWSTMSPKDRRAIILGAIVVLPALVFIYGVRPYQAAMTATRDELETARLALSREKGGGPAAPSKPGGTRTTQ